MSQATESEQERRGSTSSRALSFRKHARVHCVLKLDGKNFDGWTGNISSTGCYIIVPTSLVDLGSLEPGSVLSLMLEFPPPLFPLEVEAHLVWFTSSERDLQGRPCIGIGAKFILESMSKPEVLNSFIRDFQYMILIVGKDSRKYGVRSILAPHYRVVESKTVAEAAAELEERDVKALVVIGGDYDDTYRNELMELAKIVPYFPMWIVVGEDARLSSTLVRLGKQSTFVEPPLDETRFKKIIRHAVDMFVMTSETEQLYKELENMTKRLQTENVSLREQLVETTGYGEIVGRSDPLREVMMQLERIRSTDVTVHIHGETGTGKELVARALHVGGLRANAPFIVQNCASMTETLLQSALFGHKKGSFTGADRDQPGVFQAADKGTLMLDEVAELSLRTQGMLLRTLQDGEVIPVGANRPTKVDVRILSATAKDLRKEVQAGHFREDLFYRLYVVAINIPPLRDRPGDIILLAKHFFEIYCRQHNKKLSGISPQVMEIFENYSWPGNIRELQHELERSIVLAQEHSVVTPDLLSRHLQDVSAGNFGVATGTPITGRKSDLSFDETIREVQTQLIKNAMRKSDGVISEAARLLKMERSRLTKLKQRLNID